MSRKLTVVFLAMLVLVGAMGLKTAVVTHSGGSVMMANAGGPMPPIPKNAGGPMPPIPKNGGGPMPPIPNGSVAEVPWK